MKINMMITGDYMIGERLKAARMELGISQKDLAKKLDITPAAVSMYESGNRLPSMELFIKLVDVLNVSADEILGKSVGVANSNNDYTVRLSKEDLKIISEIKKYDKLYKRLCLRTKDIVASWNKRMG